jgi:hypothetical protein
LVSVRLKVAATRGRAAKRSFDERTRGARTGDYDGAMFAVRRAVGELETARADGAPPERFRQSHARIDDALARAAAAAADVHTALFDAAGGVFHAEIDPEVMRWKRRLNTALTLRSQHLMGQVDEEAALPITGAHVGNRAAFGPRQAGLDFDQDGEESPAVVVDLDGWLKQTLAGSAT